jgi:pantoate--beta-alanine ligase
MKKTAANKKKSAASTTKKKAGSTTKKKTASTTTKQPSARSGHAPGTAGSHTLVLLPTVVRPPTTTAVTTASEIQARMLAARAQGATIGFVPTMGALHDGHAALLDEARRRADVVVCSIFVNPLQFERADDLNRYPRVLEADLELCRRCGVDWVFSPPAHEMYPPGFDTRIVAGALGRMLEGADRPGHFDGVLTVVNMLFSIVQPHFAVFGEKDYQQLLLVRRLIKDFRLPIELVPVPVMRALDLVALSSRNARLSTAGRVLARAIPRALVAGQDTLQRGERRAVAIAAAARAVLEATPGLVTHYVEVRDASLQPVTSVETDGRLLLAAAVEGVRLIDNGPLFPGVVWRA